MKAFYKYCIIFRVHETLSVPVASHMIVAFTKPEKESSDIIEMSHSQV